MSDIWLYLIIMKLLSQGKKLNCLGGRLESDLLDVDGVVGVGADCDGKLE
jgi:hypothetical protein